MHSGESFKKIIVAGLIFGQIAFWPALAFAQVQINPVAPLLPIPINDSGSLIANNLFNGIYTPIEKTFETCTDGMKTFEAHDTISQAAFSFSAILGGGGAYAVQLGKEIVAYELYLTCLEGPPGTVADGVAPTGVIPLLNYILTPNSYTATIKLGLLNQAKAADAAYTAKLHTARERLKVASENIWKALLITVLINTTKSVADQLVNKLVNNYKIANLKGYIDSAATLMYDNQFIRDNFPDAQGQMMARAILTNPKLRNQIQPGIFSAANSALGYNPSTISLSDPNYYSRIAMAGSSLANPYYMQANYVSGVDQARANSVLTAQQQISQGNGYKAPVNCLGSLAQQQQIDNQVTAAQARLADRKALLANLQAANVTGTDLTNAKNDVAAAQAAWDKLPTTVTGVNSTGDGNGLGTAAIKICEAISSPAVLVNQGIDAVFKSVSSNMSQYNNNNLPGFLTIISNIATQIGSSLVLGGITGHPTLNESAAINGGISALAGAAIQTFNNNAAANLASGIDFSITANTGTTNGYQLSWSVDTEKVKGASYVMITGPGITGNTGRQPLSGAYAVVSANYGTYTLTVYDATGKPITTASQATSASQQAYGRNPNAPAVAGAFTTVPQIDVRGSASSFAPRGQ